MLEGLEISEVKIEEVRNDNETFRLDSEYFKKVYFDFFSHVKNVFPLSYYVKEGYRVVYENTKSIDREDAIQNNFPFFLQASDLETPFINTDKLIYVSKDEWNRYPKGRVKKGELLIEVKGKLEKVSVVPNDFPEYTLVSGSLFKLSVNDKINKHTLLTYLTSKYGVNFKERLKTNLLISYISKPDLYKIPVPFFSKKINGYIEKIFNNIFSLNTKSSQLYSDAEAFLLKKLNLTPLCHLNINTNTKSFQESFLTTGRLDAEYYQPKYDDLFSHLSKLESKKLGEIVNIKKSIEPGSDAYQDTGIPFVRVSNISKFGLTKPEIHLDANKYGNITLYPNKDTILLSKDGSVGIAYKIEEDMEIITSGALLHLNVIDNVFLPDYLTLVLNSPIVQLQAERDAGGSIIQHWKPSEIEDVIIPKLSFDKQNSISDLIQESFKLKKQSEQLLEIAKKAVEIAIEQNEAVAIEYINSYTELMQEDGKLH